MDAFAYSVDSQKPSLFLRLWWGLMGVVLLALGGGMLAASVATVAAAMSDPKPQHFVLAGLGGAIGAPCLFWAARLFAGRPRPDGGLLPPWLIVTFGLFYGSLPILALITGSWRLVQKSPTGLVLQVAIYGIAAASAIVSGFRRRRDSRTSADRGESAQ
jgi:hypothetical protein